MARVFVFNRDGELTGPVESPDWQLTDAEWRARLSPEQFRILRSQGTERPFCGTLLDNKQSGVYVCAGCGLPLFSSDSKFHSGTGWPSYFRPIAKENVLSGRTKVTACIASRSIAHAVWGISATSSPTALAPPACAFV